MTDTNASKQWREYLEQHAADPALIEYGMGLLNPYFGEPVLKDVEDVDTDALSEALALATGWPRGPISVLKADKVDPGLWFDSRVISLVREIRRPWERTVGLEKFSMTRDFLWPLVSRRTHAITSGIIRTSHMWADDCFMAKMVRGGGGIIWSCQLYFAVALVHGEREIAERFEPLLRIAHGVLPLPAVYGEGSSKEIRGNLIAVAGPITRRRRMGAAHGPSLIDLPLTDR